QSAERNGKTTGRHDRDVPDRVRVQAGGGGIAHPHRDLTVSPEHFGGRHSEQGRLSLLGDRGGRQSKPAGPDGVHVERELRTKFNDSRLEVDQPYYLAEVLAELRGERFQL